MKTKHHVLLGVFCLGLLTHSLNVQGKEFAGYVSDRLKTLLYTSPDSQKIAAYLYAGQKIQIITVNKESWNKIRLEDGTTGWIESEFITTSPGQQQQILKLNKERLNLQKELENHKQEAQFLQQELQKYRTLNVNLKKQTFNNDIDIKNLKNILANPLKINQENLQLRKNIEFLKFDNSMLQRSLQDIDEQSKSDWQTLIIICAIIFLLLGYIIGKRLAANKKASWDI